MKNLQINQCQNCGGRGVNLWKLVYVESAGTGEMIGGSWKSMGKG